MTTLRAPSSSRFVALAVILGVGVCLMMMYAPLLVWLARASAAISQLSTGAMLVVFAAVICLQDSLRDLKIEPRVNLPGLVLLAVGFICLWMARQLAVAVLPLVVFSFCCSFAGVVA